MTDTRCPPPSPGPISPEDSREGAFIKPWLDHYDPNVAPFLEYEETALHTFLDRAAATYPRRTAIWFRNWKMSYARLHRAAETMAAHLRRLGLAPGDRVAVMLPNIPQTVVTFWAVLKAGGVVVMTNPLYMESELTHHIADAGCKMMVVLDHLWKRIEPLRGRLGVETYIVTRISDCLGFPLNKLYRFKARRDGLNLDVAFDDERVFGWKPLLSGKERLSVPVANPRETLALLQYTGGTTGVSKGVMLTHFNMTANVQQCQAVLHQVNTPDERFLALLPFFHVYGLTVCLALPTAAGSMILPVPRYIPGDILDIIEKRRPTIFPGAPSIYLSLLQQKNIEARDLSSLKFCVSGSAPMPREAMRRFESLTGAEVIEGYGLSEASPVTHFNPLGGVRKVGAIGLPLSDTEARVVDMEVGCVTLPPGKDGELILRGPQVMAGYWNRPDETASTLRNGWLYTGDIARMDEEGYFCIVDRKKDMVIIGGYNVYPREIDEVLLEHPEVADAVAVGVPHPTRGEILKAYVVRAPGSTVSRGQLTAYLRGKLANYKVPKRIEFRDDLPKTIVGKVLRRALREEEEAALSRRPGS